MLTTTDEILDLLSTLIADLSTIREQITDEIDRAALNNQLTVLNKVWRKIDDFRASDPSDDLNNAKTALTGITLDLQNEKKKLVNVAKVVHKAAQAVAIAEKVLKFVA